MLEYKKSIIVVIFVELNFPFKIKWVDELS